MIEKAKLPVQVFPEQKGTRHAGFGFPILLKENADISRAELCSFLEDKNIQTRPISGANLTIQPAFQKIENAEVWGELPVADNVQKRGLFVGQSHGFSVEHGQLLLEALEEAFR